MPANPALPVPRWEAAPSVEHAVAPPGEPDWLGRLLARRGLDDPEAARRFLTPSLDQLHDPLLLDGMGDAVDRLVREAEAGGRVAVVGDYDVDGISATAQLAAVLRACGVEVVPILPHRLREGYGFQALHVERARETGCGVIVTADCGSTAHEAAEAALAAGLGLIVTDHHLVDRELPAGAIHVNPRRPGCDYPFEHLCGAGLAFKLASAVAERRGLAIDPVRLLTIACLGTICDLVPLVGENRVIAALGLEGLQRTRSVGLRALIERSGARPPLDATDVGYRLGPRLNAAGRMAGPDRALDLLLERDPARADRLAAELDGWNRERQEEERRVVAEVEAQLLDLERLPPIVALWREGWHPGVLGIAAGRIARAFGRPTLLLALEGDRATGSGRSVEGIHLHRFLSAWSDELPRFGGHAQAVGLTAPAARLDALRDAWQTAAAADWDPDALGPRRVYEERLTVSDVDLDNAHRLGRLEPFGMGNRRPLFRLGPLTVAAPPRRFGKGHAELFVRGPRGGEAPVLAWGWGERADHLPEPFEILAFLEIDRYFGRARLRLADLRAAAPDEA